MKENKPEHLETLQKIGSILLAIVAIFGAALPIAGFSFNFGYISVFGMDADLFPRSIGDLWQCSFIMSFLWLGDLLIPVASLLKYFTYYLLIPITMLGLLAVILRTTGKLPLSKKKYKAIFGKADTFFDSLEMMYNELKPLFHWSLIVFAVLMLTYFLIIDPYNRGKEFSQKALDSYNKSGCADENWSDCVEYSNPNNPLAKSYNGLLVSASSTHIAIFDGKNLSIIPRNSEYILTISYKKFDEQSEQMNSEAQNE